MISRCSAKRFIVIQILLLFLLISFISSLVQCQYLMCYYDNNGYSRADEIWSMFFDDGRVGLARMSAKELRQAIPLCSHVVYGFMGINEDYRLTSLNADADSETGVYYLKYVPSLKTSYPDVSFYLSIGGDIDTGNPERYLDALKTADRRSMLINSIIRYAKTYQFQGIDLAWQFPKERRTCSPITVPHTYWESYKFEVALPDRFRGGFSYEHASKLEVEPNESNVTSYPVDRIEVRNNFSRFLQELKEKTKAAHLSIMLTILPYVNIEFFDAKNITRYVNYIHLMAYDFENPHSRPNETFYWAVFRFQNTVCDRRRNFMSIEKLVVSWINNGIPTNRIILGVPAFGRTWRIAENPSDTGPIKYSLKATGPAPAGAYTRTPGMLSYYELCFLLQGENRSYFEPKQYILSLGTAALKRPSADENGMWLAYDNFHYIAERVKYVKELKLAGVAHMDLSLDDFGGYCHPDTFPVLKTIKNYL